MQNFREIIAGTEWGPASLSEKIEGHITPQAISQWDKVPAKRVLEVEKITGISRHVLRPDIFGSTA